MTITRLIDLKSTLVKGFTAYDEDGNQNIYINTRFNCESQEKTAQHELKHGQFDCPDVQVLEKILHR